MATSLTDTKSEERVGGKKEEKDAKPFGRRRRRRKRRRRVANEQSTQIIFNGAGGGRELLSPPLPSSTLQPLQHKSFLLLLPFPSILGKKKKKVLFWGSLEWGEEGGEGEEERGRRKEGRRP